jgi:antitoxin ParD1/3/4
MQTTEKLSITLPRDMAQMVRGKVELGACASNSEVIREALRLMQERDGDRAHKLAWLREKIDRSLTDPRPSVDADEVFARLEERHRRRDEGGA